MGRQLEPAALRGYQAATLSGKLIAAKSTVTDTVPRVRLPGIFKSVDRAGLEAQFGEVANLGFKPQRAHQIKSMT